MRYLSFILIVSIFVSCKTKPFTKHSMKFEKVSENCSGIDQKIKMNSNLNGERLEFQACLDADFQKAQLTSFRQGDTVVLKFDRTKSQQALYNIILDVDSYPRYYFLSIDGNTFPIIPAGN